MGRAKSNTKRRPKGKRGWRKIELFPESKDANFMIQQSNDRDLFFFDKKPRQQTKSDLKQSSKNALIKQGIEFNNKTNKKSVEIQKKIIPKIAKQHQLSELTRLFPLHSVKSAKNIHKYEKEIEFRNKQKKRKPTKPKNMTKEHIFKYHDIWDDTSQMNSNMIDLPRNNMTKPNNKNKKQNLKKKVKKMAISKKIEKTVKKTMKKTNKIEKTLKKSGVLDKKIEKSKEIGENKSENEKNEIIEDSSEPSVDIDLENTEEDNNTNTWVFGSGEAPVSLSEKKSKIMIESFRREHKKKFEDRMEKSNTTTTNNNDTTTDDIDIDHKSYFAGEYIKLLRKSGKAHMKSHRPVYNPSVLQSHTHNGISSIKPHSGESINPMPLHFYQLGWESSKVQAKNYFEDEWQGNERTKKWYESQRGRTTVRTMRKKSKYHQSLKVGKAMKDEYFTELKKWRKARFKVAKKQKKKNGIDNNNGEIERRVIENNNNNNNKRGVFYDRQKNANKNRKKKGRLFVRGRVYGREHRFQPRAIRGLHNLHTIKRGMRYHLDNGIDNGLSHLYNQFQRYNKIEGRRIKKFLFKRRPFYGAGFKVQTRIGKLHHANVGTKLFQGIDDNNMT